mgnify:FL=1
MNKISMTIFVGILLVAAVTAMIVEQQVTVNVLPEVILTINSPKDIIYDIRRIPINLSGSEEADEILYINHNDRIPRLIRLCSNCDEYGLLRRKLHTVNEGENNLTFEVITKSGNKDEFNVSFIVDSKVPRIIKTSPLRGFANGSFEVEFIEDNAQELILFYGNSIRNKTLDIENDCIQNEKSNKCASEVDLSDFDGQEISYFFQLTDIAGSLDESRQINMNVDLSPPVLNFFNFTAEKRSVIFKFNITELNFKRVEYIDILDRNPRLTNLCTRLRNEICEVKRAFNPGDHNLTIKISDKADNTIEINEVNFII